jgi:hypothetical protein
MLADVVWLEMDWRREAALVDVMAVLVKLGVCEEERKVTMERGREKVYECRVGSNIDGGALPKCPRCSKKVLGPNLLVPALIIEPHRVWRPDRPMATPKLA